jgi:hypothetical protein
MLFIQISVITLVIAQQMLVIQISLGLLLVMKQQMLNHQISLVFGLEQATNAYQSNFFGGGLVVVQQCNTSNFFGFKLVWCYIKYSSNFLGQNAGLNATGANNSNVFW